MVGELIRIDPPGGESEVISIGERWTSGSCSRAGVDGWMMLDRRLGGLPLETDGMSRDRSIVIVCIKNRGNEKRDEITIYKKKRVYNGLKRKRNRSVH